MAEGKPPSFGAFLGRLAFVGLAIWGVIQGVNSLWGEQEGFVKTDDCRRTVMVKAGSPETWFKEFTCTYRRTQKGLVMSGTCVAVETEGSVCQTVYTYQIAVNNGGCKVSKFHTW